jgi:hypothetical protein
MQRMMIRLRPDEVKALKGLADKQHRNSKQQAEFLIRQALERAGLLQSTQQGEPDERNN